MLRSEPSGADVIWIQQDVTIGRHVMHDVGTTPGHLPVTIEDPCADRSYRLERAM